MNVFSYLLAEGEISPSPECSATKFNIDDNIGESIHIHYRNTRIEFSIEDFLIFANAVEHSKAEDRDGNC